MVNGNSKKAIVFGSKRIPYISVPLRSIGIETYEIYSWGYPFRRLKAVFTLYRLCRRFPDAHIIVDTPQWIGLAALIVTTLVKRDYFLLLRGDIFKEIKGAFGTRMNKKILREARGIIFLSHYLKNRILDELPSIKTHAVIPPPYLFKPNKSKMHKKKKILTITGFYFYEKIKPLLIAMDAIDEFLDRFPDAIWDICGGGRYLKEAREKVDKLKHKDRINLHGHCTHVASLYKSAFVFLYITGLDVFALVISEAFLYGLPVVANNIMSMPEVIEDEKDGFLVNMNLKDWKKKIIDRLTFLFENPQAAREMGLRGKEKVLERCNPERVGALLAGFIGLSA